MSGACTPAMMALHFNMPRHLLACEGCRSLLESHLKCAATFPFRTFRKCSHQLFVRAKRFPLGRNNNLATDDICCGGARADAHRKKREVRRCLCRARCQSMPNGRPGRMVRGLKEGGEERNGLCARKGKRKSKAEHDAHEEYRAQRCRHQTFARAWLFEL